MENDSDFVVVLASRDGTRKIVTDDPLTVGIVRDRIRSATAEVRPWRPTDSQPAALPAGTTGPTNLN